MISSTTTLVVPTGCMSPISRGYCQFSKVIARFVLSLSAVPFVAVMSVSAALADTSRPPAGGTAERTDDRPRCR